MRITGKKKGVNKKGSEYILVRMYDAAGTGDAFEIVDKQMDRFDMYEVDKKYNIEFDLTQSKGYTNLSIVGVEEYVEEDTTEKKSAKK